MKTFTTYAEKKAKQFLNLLQGYTKGIRFTAILILLLMGVNNAWAGEGFYGIYIKYNHNGTAKTSDGEWTNPLNLGTLTSDFKVTDVYLKVWWENWSPTMSAQLHYWKDGNEQWSGTFKNVKSTGGNDREVYVENWNKVLASTTETSGSHEITYKWEAYFSTVTHTLPSSGTKKITYTVAPPAVKSFTVTPSGDFISGSGEQDDPYIIRYNGSLTLTLSGSQNHTDANSTIQYNTSGTWDNTNSRTISNITSTDVKNVTVQARYKHKSENLYGTESSQTIYYRSEQVYTVTFNANGHGTAPDAQTVTQGSKATQPTAPTATGYTFDGWYKESNCTNAFDFNTAINANITLYAKWEERKLWINGDRNIATNQPMIHDINNPRVYTYTIKAVNKTEGEGYYHFKFYNTNNGIEENMAYGWTTIHKPLFTNNEDVVTKIGPDPGWSTNIIFSLTRKSDITITLTLQSDDDSTEPTVQIDANPYYTIKWMDGQGNQIGEAQELHAGETITLPEVEPRMGYKFVGWNTAKDGTGSAPTQTVEGDATYYQVWEERLLYIKANWLNDIGGYTQMTRNSDSEYTYQLNSMHPTTYAFQICDKNGEEYQLAYCYTNVQEPTTSSTFITNIGNKMDDDAEIQFNLERWSDLTITLTLKSANDDPKPTVELSSVPYYTLTYDLNYDAQPNRIFYFEHLLSGANIKIAEGTPTRTGYTFTGWNSEIDGKGDAPDPSKPMGEQDRTYYAQWTVNQYRLTWDLNGGTVTQEGTLTGLVDYGHILTPPTLTQTGYTHTGWSPEVPSTMPASDATYRAQWTINQYTITYGVFGGANGTIRLDGGTEVTSSSTKTDYYNTSYTLVAEPNNNETHKIEGWYSDVDCTKKIADGSSNRYSFTLTNDMTVYVKFIEADEKTYPVTVTATAGGTVRPSGTVEVGNRTPITFTATPAAGYRFYKWTYTGGVETSGSLTNSSIDITANGTGTLTANFVRVHTVNFFATPAVAGTATATATVNGNANAITSGDKLDDKTSVTFTADVANAYDGQCTFVKWVDGAGTQLSNASRYQHTVTEDITVKAIFKIKQYTLTFSAGEGGHVSAIANNSAIASPANLDYNTSVTLTAEPDAGCAFEGWYEGKTKKSSEISYTINLTADKTIEAQFTKGTTVYMKAIEYWKKDHPRYAIYYWGAGDKNGWHDMTNVDCNGDIYEGYVPAGYTNFKFVRLAPSTSNEWENKWNETPDLTTTNHAGEMYIHPHVYLKPNSDWKSNGARFAAYFYADGKEAKWFSMNDLDGDGIYSCEIPTGYTSVIFCRMNPNFDTNDWDRDGNDYVWNQTGDLNINTNTSLFTITGWGTGSWYAGPHKNGWQTYAEPSYKITYSQPTNGTITVTTKAGAAIKNGDELTMGDEIKITFTPADGYELINYNVEYATETGEEGVYSVCGPTNITTVEFAKAGTARTVYLRPNEDWMKDEPIFAAYAWNNKNTTQNHWYIMTTKADDYTGAYSCNISSTYDMVTFVRIKPKGRDNSDGTLDFQNAWNQTIDLQIMNNIPRFAIGEERTVGDKQKYDGAWEKNTPIWGLATNFNDWKAEKAVFKGYPGKLDVAPPFGTSHEFKLYNFFGIEASNNLWHGNSGTMKRANSGQWWTMEGTQGANCKMMLDVSGEYIYQMRFLTIGTDLKKQVSVTYPEADMYYVMYEETTSEGTKQRISYGIGITGEERLDTVSFFVDIAKSAKIYILNSNREKVGDYYTIIGTGGENQGGAMAPKRRAAAEEDPTLRVEQGCGIEESGVYNFVAQQDAKGKVTLLINDWHAYTGAYYIRTDAASGGWGSYKQNGNKMTYTSYADKNHNFDHYYCKWITSSSPSYSNVKFCVANDYSHQLSDELDGDEIIEKALVPTGCLPANANVRFGWDSKTNELTRAYISGSSDAADRFLVLTGNEYLLDINGNKLKVDGLYDNEAIFGDQGNWVYQLDVQANTQTAIKLTAKFNDRVQTFFGDARAAADGEEVMAATTPEYHKVRMIYNFKTNHLLAAWLLDHPNQDINNGEVNANVLIIRENHGDANQLQFNNNLTEMTVNTAYAVMTFTEKHVTNNSLTNFARYEYWVSFPFDVKISDVFGFGEYGDTWIMQLYDGAGRAEKGYWADSPTFWKYITNKNYTLKAGVGYVLKLDKGQMATKDEGAWAHTDAVSLYFPSTPNDAGNTIISATPDTQHEIPSHECTIQREKRYIYDSHWNLIGVPGYANIKDFNTAATLSPVKYEAGQVSFYYEYLSADNSYQATSAKSDFKNMHSYMVQFAGTINWSTPDTPTKLAARRNSDYAEPEKVSFRLELAQGEEKADQTFVQLQQEGATPDFDMNLDLTKIINSGANIYTLAGESRIQSAGNALPMGEAVVVPVGVKVDAEGEYTFRMPDGTEGMVVELVDYETNNRTNLLLSDYIVTLTKGTSENRFALHIQPQKDVVTSLENIGEGVNNGEAVNKYLIDGKLIIRTAEGIFDAQGHRL